MKRTFAAKTFAANTFACGNWTGVGLPTVAGPYRIAAAGSYVPTALIGEVYGATAAAGEGFAPGAARGQVVSTEY